MDVQVVVHGPDTADARPTVAMVDRLDQVDIVLEGEDAVQVMFAVLGIVDRFR